MERIVSCKCSLSPSPFPLSSCFAGCCLPLSATETAGQEAYLHPAVWLMHGQQMARGTGNTQAARIIPGEGSTARPQGTASSSLHTGILRAQGEGWRRPVLTPHWPGHGLLQLPQQFHTQLPHLSICRHHLGHNAPALPLQLNTVFRKSLQWEKLTCKFLEVFCYIFVTLFKY